VINFDLPRSVESYAHRAAAAVPPKNGNGLPGVIVSFVQAAGGDVEMLRSTECAYRFKVCLLSNEMWCEADDSPRKYLLYSMICSIINIKRSERE
jgi:hypothetical protein